MSAVIKNCHNSNPFFSICIPQYNRTSFLIEQCRVLREQSFKNFEICISDGGSTDGRHEELVGYLKNSSMDFIFSQAEKNKQYDENLRSAISMASGQYCLLMGNDDCLVAPDTLEKLHQKILDYQMPAGIITNFQDWKTGEIVERVLKTQIIGSGPWTILAKFRSLAFVSGLLLNRQKCFQYASNIWDGSEMYQMYLFAKIIGEGGKLLELKDSYIRKDIQIDGEQVDSYVKAKWNASFSEVNKLALLKLAVLNFDGVKDFLNIQEQKSAAEKILLQLYLFTYAFWILDFRKTRSWKYAFVFALSCRLNNIAQGMPLSWFQRAKLRLIHIFVATCALFFPRILFLKFKNQLYRLAKKR